MTRSWSRISIVDLNEAERVGSSDHVHIVAQIDRFQAGYSGRWQLDRHPALFMSPRMMT